MRAATRGDAIPANRDAPRFASIWIVVFQEIL
jgi:hypothetical protein